MAPEEMNGAEPNEVTAPAAENLPIKDVKEVAVVLAKMGVSIAQCLLGKKFEMGYFVDDIMAIPPAIDNITAVPEQFKDMDSPELSEVLQAVVAELSPLGISDKESAKHFINAGIHLAQGTMGIVEGVKALKVEKAES